MYDVNVTINPLVGKQVGYASSIGQCGALASYWLSVLTDKCYQFAYGMSGIQAKWVPGSDCATAWNVYAQTNWTEIGFEKIDNPKFSQLKAGDIFFISAREGLSTGHVGIIASVDNGNITTYEQNIDGKMYVQYLPNRNSWSIYGGFSGIVRKKGSNNQPEQKGEIDMIIYQVSDSKSKMNGSIWCFNGEQLTRLNGTSAGKLKQTLKTVSINQAEMVALKEVGFKIVGEFKY